MVIAALFWNWLGWALAGTAAGAVVLAACVRAERKRRKREHRREIELLERLAGGLAHELKNPLGALNLNVQLLEEELESSGSLSEASRDRISKIKGEYRRFESVIDDFLRYASRKQLSLARVDMNDVAGDLATFVKPEFHRRGVAIALEPSEGPAVASADAALLKQALLNLILNALESIPGPGSVAMSVSRDDDCVRIVVKDTGSGVAAADLPHIFEAYFSTKKRGSGLGLAIAKRIIEDHGGTISVESSPGVGTAATITLPSAGPRPM
jgi:signal transduction histidine kinase